MIGGAALLYCTQTEPRPLAIIFIRQAPKLISYRRVCTHMALSLYIRFGPGHLLQAHPPESSFRAHILSHLISAQLRGFSRGRVHSDHLELEL